MTSFEAGRGRSIQDRGLGAKGRIYGYSESSYMSTREGDRLRAMETKASWIVSFVGIHNLNARASSRRFGSSVAAKNLARFAADRRMWTLLRVLNLCRKSSSSVSNPVAVSKHKIANIAL